MRTLVPYLSVLLRPILPFVGLPPPSRALVSSPTTLRHVLHLASSEMATIRAPQESWFRSQGKLPLGEGTHGVWTAKGMDGWVGADGPLIRGWLGKKRVLELEGVPHAFCLCKCRNVWRRIGADRQRSNTVAMSRMSWRLGSQSERRRRLWKLLHRPSHCMELASISRLESTRTRDLC